jgi:hypothetical protein
MVVQIFVFMVLILGSAYQSLMITELTEPLHEDRITTIDEMLVEDYNYIVDPLFYNMMDETQKNVYMKKNLTKDISIYEKPYQFYREAAANNTVLIMRCDIATDDLLYPKDEDPEHPSDFYYLLSEGFSAMHETLMTTRFSPFTERFEEFSLRIFESGIKQHWKTLLHNTLTASHRHRVDAGDDMLTLDEIKLVFYIWGIGLIPALIAFLAELLCHRYQARIQRSWVGKVMRKISDEEQRERREREEVERMRRRRMRTAIEEGTFEMINCEG